MRKWTGWLGPLIFFIFISGCADHAPGDSREEPVTVRIAEAKERTIPGQFSYQALLQPAEPREISAQVSGLVENIPVKAGQTVNRGDLLLSINSETLALALSNAQQESAQARLQEEKLRVQLQDSTVRLQRQQLLFASGALSKEAMEKAQLELQLLERDMKQAESQAALALNRQRQAELDLNRCSITAPEPMTVAEILIDVGRHVAAGQALMRGGNAEKLQVVVEVSRDEAAGWKVGDKLQVNSRERAREASISHISSLAVPGTGRIEAVLEIDNRDLAWNAGEWAMITGDITIPGQVVVPLEAVAQGDSPYVYMVREGRLHKQPVKLGAAEGAYLAVEGLEPGTMVVDGGLQRLRDGQLVNGQKEDDA
jgi:RND family efflux transporter MFP subunit